MVKKKHHYLTRYYLEGFCDANEMVWTYLKASSKKPFPQKPENTALENKLYNLNIQNSPELISKIEDYFSHKIETPAADPFKKLIARSLPDSDAKNKLSLFFGSLFVRTPSYLAHLDKIFSTDLHHFVKTLASNKDHYHESWKNFDPSASDTEIEEYRQLVLKENIIIGVNRNFLLENMVLMIKIIASFLYAMKWCLIETNKDWHFITSDSLANIVNADIKKQGFYQPGFGMHNSEVTIPISKYLTLVMINNSNLKEDIFSINNQKKSFKFNLKDIIKNLNKITVLRANQFIFSSTNSEKIKRLLINCSNIKDLNKGVFTSC